MKTLSKASDIVMSRERGREDSRPGRLQVLLCLSSVTFIFFFYFLMLPITFNVDGRMPFVSALRQGVGGNLPSHPTQTVGEEAFAS